MAYDEFTAKMVRRVDALEQALAEKDMEWKRRVGLDCGGHSCFYAIEKTGMRHNGRCSCDPKRTKQDYMDDYLDKFVKWLKSQQQEQQT